MQHREVRLRSSSYQTKSSTFFEHLISQRLPQARERSGGHHDGAITTFHVRIKISSFHFPPVGFAGFFSCPITGSVLLLYQLPSAWRSLLVALFARICGLHDVAKGVADTHFRTSVEAREEWVFCWERTTGTDAVPGLPAAAAVQKPTVSLVFLIYGMPRPLTSPILLPPSPTWPHSDESWS